MKIIFACIIAVAIAACNHSEPEAQGDWIKGSEHNKIEIIEKQFRGLDNAMVETGYRYQELFWAGKDENWPYASYQLQKIKIAIENGIQRRPNRATSAKQFFQYAMPELQKSIESKDTSAFSNGFQILTNGCKNCHIRENAPYINFIKPNVRLSPATL